VGRVPLDLAALAGHRVASDRLEREDAEQEYADASSYAPITAPAGNHRSSTVTTARPNARSVSSAVAMSPPPPVISRPAAPGYSPSA
jgi:hypothetical protein